MPHAMTDAFSVDDTLTEAALAAPVAPAGLSLRQQESETPNERAMRVATAATKKAEPAKRQQG